MKVKKISLYSIVDVLDTVNYAINNQKSKFVLYDKEINITRTLKFLSLLDYKHGLHCLYCNKKAINFKYFNRGKYKFPTFGLQLQFDKKDLTCYSTIDHKKFRSFGGTHSYSNLVLSCMYLV